MIRLNSEINKEKQHKIDRNGILTPYFLNA